VSTTGNGFDTSTISTSQNSGSSTGHVIYDIAVDNPFEDDTQDQLFIGGVATNGVKDAGYTGPSADGDGNGLIHDWVDGTDGPSQYRGGGAFYWYYDVSDIGAAQAVIGYSTVSAAYDAVGIFIETTSAGGAVAGSGSAASNGTAVLSKTQSLYGVGSAAANGVGFIPAPLFPPYILQVKSSTGDFGGTQDPSVTLDADPQVGNFLLGIYIGGGNWNQNANPPTGWTESVDNQGVDPPFYGQWIGYKTAVANDAGPHVLDLSFTDGGVFFIVELDSKYFSTDDLDSTIEWFQRTGASEGVTTWDPADSTLASTDNALIFNMVATRNPVDAGSNAQTFSHSGTNTNVKIDENAADTNDGANSTDAYSVGLFADEFSGSTTYDPGQFSWQDSFASSGYGRPHGMLIRIPIKRMLGSGSAASTGTAAVTIPLPFRDDFTGTTSDPWHPNKWPTITSEGSVAAFAELDTGTGSMSAGTAVDDFVAANAPSVTNLQDSQGQITIAPQAGTHNQWLYLCLRSSGEQTAANAGRPSTAYYFRFKTATNSIADDALYRRISDVESPALVDGLDGTNATRVAGDPFVFKWEIQDNGSEVDFRWKIWDVGTGSEPGGWETYTDTTPGALLGASGIMQLLLRNFVDGLTASVTVDDVFYDALVSTMRGTGSVASNGVGVLSKAQAIQGVGSVASTGDSVLSKTQTLQGIGSAASAGDSVLNKSQGLFAAGNAASTGNATVSSTQSLYGSGSAASASSATLSGAQTLNGVGAAASSGDSTITSTQALIGSGASASAGDATVSQGAATEFMFGVGSAASSGVAVLLKSQALFATGTVASDGTATLSSTQNLIASGAAASNGTATLTLTQTLFASGAAASDGDATISSTQSLYGSGASAAASAATLSGAQTLYGVGIAASSGTAVLSSIQSLIASAAAASASAAQLSALQSLLGSGAAASNGSAVASILYCVPPDADGTRNWESAPTVSQPLWEQVTDDVDANYIYGVPV
jgi:hypothetical protein